MGPLPKVAVSNLRRSGSPSLRPSTKNASAAALAQSEVWIEV
jgi:hypothetical protein